MVRFFRTGLVESDALIWRFGDRSMATVVLKCTLAPDSHGALGLVRPDEIVKADNFVEQNPAHPLRDASDMVPYLGRGEVLFFGDAFGRSGTRSQARLCVRSPATNPPEVLVDKAIVVIIPPSGSALGRVSVSYENAFGGLGNVWNPVGRPDPLIFHTTAPQFPAAMGPLPRSWKLRASLLRPEDKAPLRAEQPQIRQGFNWAFFHAAPPDQRASRHFHGDEIVDLDGLWPHGGHVQLELPKVRAEARLLTRAGHQNISVQADIMRIDSDRGCISLTWRGTLPIAMPNERMYIGVGVSVRGIPIQWPDWEVDTLETFEDADTVGPMSERTHDELEETASALRLDELRSRTLPFKAGPPDPRSSQRMHEGTGKDKTSFPGAPWGGPEEPTVIPSLSQKSTLFSEGREPPTVEIPALRISSEAPATASPMAPQKATPPPKKADKPARDYGVVDLGGGLGAELLLAMVERVKKGVGSP